MTQSPESAIEKTKDTINNTRDRVRDRVNSMQEELSPAALLDRFAPQGQPLSESIRQVGDAAKRNPLATALLAGGAILLGREVISGSDGHTAKYSAEKDAAARVGKHVKSVKDATAEMAETASEITETAKRKALDGVDAASSTADDLVRAGKQQANSAYRSVNHAVRASTTDAAKAASTGKRWVEDNPVAAGLACVAVGALAASFFTAKPISDYREYDEGDDRDQADAKPVKARKASSRKAAGKKQAARKAKQPKQARRAVNTRGARTVKTRVKATSPSARKPVRSSATPSGPASPTVTNNRSNPDSDRSS